MQPMEVRSGFEAQQGVSLRRWCTVPVVGALIITGACFIGVYAFLLNQKTPRYEFLSSTTAALAPTVPINAAPVSAIVDCRAYPVSDCELTKRCQFVDGRCVSRVGDAAGGSLAATATNAPTNSASRVRLTAAPIAPPTAAPTPASTSAPSAASTSAPSAASTEAAAVAPSFVVRASPASSAPSSAPSSVPSSAPSSMPSSAPSSVPSLAPSSAPSLAPIRPLAPPKLLTHNGVDGLGHQLLGAFSCMVYARLRPALFTYVRRAGDSHRFGHECNGCHGLYDALHVGWAHALGSTGVQSQDNCWAELREACSGSPGVPDPACQAARQYVAGMWRYNFEEWNREHPEYHPDSSPHANYDVVVHFRLGDRPVEIVVEKYNALFRSFEGRRIGIFTENANEVTATFSEIAEHAPTAGTLHDWLAMARAPVLVMHLSSYSVSASYVRLGRSYGVDQYMMEGRYDMHQLVCFDDSTGWFYEDGGYANMTCPA